MSGLEWEESRWDRQAGSKQILQKLVVCGQESRFYSQNCGKPKEDCEQGWYMV